MSGALVFMIIFGATSLLKFFGSLINFKINLKNFIFTFLFIMVIQAYLSNKFSVPYLGYFKDSTNTGNIQNRTDIATRGTASWPEWTTINSPIEIFYKGPIRSMYLVYAPFLWDVNKLRHLNGMFDGLLYMYLSYLVLRNLK